jgi:hypothetical protein
MRISRNYTVENWKAIGFTSEADWHCAIGMLKDRLETRYLEHIRELLPRKTSGFVVLALDCTLIETIEQFKRGTRKTPQRQGERYFVSFLTSDEFSPHFNETRAKVFYRQIRCGLLHQSEAEGISRIKRGSALPLVSETADLASLVINKEAFHELLEQSIEGYYARLRSGDDQQLRAAFRRKMNAICRIEGSDV